MSLDLDALNGMVGVDPEPDQSILDRFRFDDALEVPHQFTDIDIWLNYCNDDLYELDKAVRGVLLRTRWTRMTKGKLSTAVPLVFVQIFGRKPEAADSQVCVMMHRLLKYYCTSYTGTSKIAGQRFSHVYHFSKYSVQHKRAMSLRLRLEEANGRPVQIRDNGAGKDKRAQARRGTTPHGPLAAG